MAPPAICAEHWRLDSQFDIILIDTGAGISRNTMGFVTACNEVIVVTTPELTAITDAYGIIKLLVTDNPSVTVRVVVNMVKSEAEAERILASLQSVVDQFLKTRVSLDLLGYVPHDCGGLPGHPRAMPLCALLSGFQSSDERRGDGPQARDGIGASRARGNRRHP